jgi:hypothetical protein
VSRAVLSPAAIRALLPVVAQSTPEELRSVQGARFEFRAGAYEMRLAGVAGTSTMSREAARDSWLRAVRRKLRAVGEPVVDFDGIPGACPDDPANLAGSGPVPIEPREG